MNGLKVRKVDQAGIRTVPHTHYTARLVNHNKFTFSVLMQYLDGFRRDWRLVTMHDIFEAIAVPHDRARLGNLAIDGSDA